MNIEDLVAGDCLVAFSRRAVHGLKREVLRRSTFKCCLVGRGEGWAGGREWGRVGGYPRCKKVTEKMGEGVVAAAATKDMGGNAYVCFVVGLGKRQGGGGTSLDRECSSSSPLTGHVLGGGVGGSQL